MEFASKRLGQRHWRNPRPSDNRHATHRRLPVRKINQRLKLTPQHVVLPDVRNHPGYGQPSLRHAIVDDPQAPAHSLATRPVLDRKTAVHDHHWNPCDTVALIKLASRN